MEIGKAPRQQNSAASSLFPQTREHAVRRTPMKRCHRRSVIPSAPALSLDANGGGPGPEYRCHCHGFVSKVHWETGEMESRGTGEAVLHYSKT